MFFKIKQKVCKCAKEAPQQLQCVEKEQ